MPNPKKEKSERKTENLKVVAPGRFVFFFGQKMAPLSEKCCRPLIPRDVYHLNVEIVGTLINKGKDLVY